MMAVSLDCIYLIALSFFSNIYFPIDSTYITEVFFRSSNPDVLRLLNRLDGKPDQPINLQNNDPYMYSYDIRKVLEYYEKR
jgi:hypothetical protein